MMTTVDQTAPAGLSTPGLANLIVLGLVWLTFAISGYVIAEPAPYDALMVGLVLLLPLTRLTDISVHLVVLLLLWCAVLVGAYLATAQSTHFGDGVKHATITLYLALSAVILAGFIAMRPVAHSRVILSAWAVAAALATTAAIAGYFQLFPGAFELFTRAGRARGTFEDPNVYGPFIIPVLLWLVHLLLDRSFIRSFVVGGLLAYLLFGLLIAFSRGAWLNTVVSFAMYGGVAFLTAHTHRLRLRLIVLAIGAVFAAATIVVIALNWSATADLLRERAQVEQSYDTGREGRFGGQMKAVGVILDHPLGIGPVEFGRLYHHEDAHNVYLTAFLDYGWIGGFAFLVTVLCTLAVGIRTALSRGPAQDIAIIAFAAFFGLTVEGIVVDTYHWRHFFVLMAFIWGIRASLAFARAPISRSEVLRRSAAPVVPPRRRGPVLPSRPSAPAASAPGAARLP